MISAAAWLRTPPLLGGRLMFGLLDFVKRQEERGRKSRFAREDEEQSADELLQRLGRDEREQLRPAPIKAVPPRIHIALVVLFFSSFFFFDDSLDVRRAASEFLPVAIVLRTNDLPKPSHTFQRQKSFSNGEIYFLLPFFTMRFT